jgi:glycosyltransferase involved in cell wall biosynthesis
MRRRQATLGVRRLGVYSDGPFRVVDTSEGARLSPDPADLPFLTFACEVGTSFDSTVLFARATRAPGDGGGLLLPESIGFVELPFYESLFHVGQLLRAVPGTARGFWRGVGQVDAVWVLGPHPFAFLLVPLAFIRGKRVVLGVRQDSVAYYRARLRSERWKPVLLVARAWDVGFRAFSRRLRTVVVGPELARRYGGPRPTLMTTTVSLLRDADVVDVPRPRDWTGEISLFTVGRIDREKNPLLLIEAVARLQRDRPGRFRLVWAGMGPLEDGVRQRARELGVADRIELLGFVPFGPALLERYRSAHAFVHVSLTEGLPATLVEALGSGTPVVATAVGGVPSALDGGRAGLLVPPSDLDALVAAIVRLQDDPELRDRLVDHGLRLARDRTLEANASRVARFIRDDVVAADDADGAEPVARRTRS